MKVFKVHYKIMKDNKTILSVTDYSDDLDSLMKIVSSHASQSYKGNKEIGKIDIKELDGLDKVFEHVRNDFKKYGTLAAFHDTLEHYQNEIDDEIAKVKI